MIRVLFLTRRLDYGGAERQLMDAMIWCLPVRGLNVQNMGIYD
jgi:hypothetical protein